MAAAEQLTKRVAIDKANLQMIIIIAVASFITVFCIFASKAVISQNGYQSRVTAAQNKANNQLQENLTAYNELSSAYNKFTNTNPNIIGGSTTGTGSNAGTNAAIVLHALPSYYDFPALTSTIEKILTDRGLPVTSISGNDDELTEQGDSYSQNPAPVPMPFTFSIGSATYQQVSQLMTALQESTRPIQVDTLDLTGTDASLQVTVSAHTYFQPGKSLNITKQVIQ